MLRCGALGECAVTAFNVSARKLALKPDGESDEEPVTQQREPRLRHFSRNECTPSLWISTVESKAQVIQESAGGTAW